MYHRFEENKYPSTNVKIDVFQEHLNIIRENNFSFLNPKNFELEFNKVSEEKKILLTIDDAFSSFYLNAWQRKVETAGYYEISRKDITQGNFKVQIRSIIDSMGNLIGADILKSSGNSSMDALALKILQQSAPFEPFPQDMAVNYQQLEIIRDWNFTNS